MYLLLGLMTLFHHVNSQTIRQTPAAVSRFRGDEVELECTMEGSNNPDMFWYRQYPGREPQLMFYSRGTNQVNSEGPVDGFKAQRPSDSKFMLESPSLRGNHSAVYYCAWSVAGNELYFGDGTKLTVLDKNDKISNAKVSIFEPSPEEIKKGKATVVCLVTDFYPDNIEINWFVDDMVKKANDPSIQTDLNSISSEGNKSFSISSRLRLDAQDWIWVKTITCTVKHYIGASDVRESNYTLHIKAVTCGVSKEAKMQSMGAAKLTYLILICKSIFYGIFISILAWKTKTSYSKRFD